MRVGKQPRVLEPSQLTLPSLLGFPLLSSCPLVPSAAPADTSAVTSQPPSPTVDEGQVTTTFACGNLLKDGKYDNAIPQLQGVLPQYNLSSLYGPNHPATIGVMNMITSALDGVGRKKDDMGMREQAMILKNQGLAWVACWW